MAEKKTKETLPAKADEGTTAMEAYKGFEEYAGRGFQNQTNEDIAIPFINVLQAMSPEVQEEGGVEGARPGMLFNSVTQELYKGIEFVPAITQHVYVEWKPRDAGGGLIAQHAIHSDVVKRAKAASTEFGKYRTEAGNDLIETFYVFGILSTPNGASMAVMAFTSTKIKAYKSVMGRLNAFQLNMPDGRRINPPLFAHLLSVTTKQEKNSKGTFYVPLVQPAVENDVQKSLLSPEDPRFRMAAECERLVSSGAAKADMSGAEPRTPAEDGVDDPF